MSTSHSEKEPERARGTPTARKWAREGPEAGGLVWGPGMKLEGMRGDHTENWGNWVGERHRIGRPFGTGGGHIWTGDCFWERGVGGSCPGVSRRLSETGKPGFAESTTPLKPMPCLESEMRVPELEEETYFSKLERARPLADWAM